MMRYSRQFPGFFHLKLGIDYIVINTPESAEVGGSDEVITLIIIIVIVRR